VPGALEATRRGRARTEPAASRAREQVPTSLGGGRSCWNHEVHEQRVRLRAWARCALERKRGLPPSRSRLARGRPSKIAPPPPLPPPRKRWAEVQLPVPSARRSWSRILPPATARRQPSRAREQPRRRARRSPASTRRSTSAHRTRGEHGIERVHERGALQARPARPPRTRSAARASSRPAQSRHEVADDGRGGTPRARRPRTRGAPAPRSSSPSAWPTMGSRRVRREESAAARDHIKVNDSSGGAAATAVARSGIRADRRSPQAAGAQQRPARASRAAPGGRGALMRRAPSFALAAVSVMAGEVVAADQPMGAPRCETSRA
jgi:hypothetical protein